MDAYSGSGLAQDPAVSPGLIREIDAIQEELERAFVQAALEYAYRAATAVDRGEFGLADDEARRIDERATELALAAHAHRGPTGLASRPPAAGRKAVEAPSMFMVSPTGDLSAHEQVVPAKTIEELDPKHADTVRELAAAWAAEMKPRLEQERAEREFERLVALKETEERNQQAYLLNVVPLTIEKQRQELEVVQAREQQLQREEQAQGRTERIQQEREALAQRTAQVRDQLAQQEQLLALELTRIERQHEQLRQREARAHQEAQQRLQQEQLALDPTRQQGKTVAVQAERDRQTRQMQAQEQVQRWNDLAAQEASARALRAQTEIMQGGDPVYWMKYAAAERSMVNGLKAPELAADGQLNGHTTQQYQPTVQRRAPQARTEAEERFDQRTSVKESKSRKIEHDGPSMASVMLVGMGIGSTGLMRSREIEETHREVTHEMEWSFEHRFEPIHEPGA